VQIHSPSCVNRLAVILRASFVIGQYEVDTTSAETRC